MTVAEPPFHYRVRLVPGSGTAEVLRLLGVLHARNAQVLSLDYRHDTDLLSIVARPRPGGARSLARSLTRPACVLRVTEPQEAVAEAT